MISLTSPIETVFHRMPAGAKLAALCLFTLMIFLSNSLGWHVACGAVIAGLYLLGGRAFAGAGLKALKPLWPFFAVIAVWHFFTQTFEAGLLIALRLAATVALANLVTMTTRLDAMMGVLRWVLTPLRKLGVRTHALEVAIALVIRFTPEIARNGALLAEAWQARSVRRAGWRLIAPLALLTLDDAEHVADALRARGGIINKR